MSTCFCLHCSLFRLFAELLRIGTNVDTSGRFSAFSAEVQQIHPLVFRRAPIAKSLPQIPFGHFPLAVRCKQWGLCH